ncbi:calcium-binding protein [Marinovum sp. 2_MG-2023]|uniref:calcium-binding protein n=1 Tax=unclassified Marinovum TaxID=2647166 RepID=UPI0026E263C0|nr:MULTISPECIES: calcium-binding protein [unclassified Marinovum]MDO6732814.1 calcium-binding protein [Marinovum sp. 2_MG-2023]MDO6782109.1 calcium-binding protein [Marinovum sp. 1_MG-2023]
MISIASTIRNSGGAEYNIDRYIFGVNTLFHNDSVATGSDYNEVIDRVNPTVIRFPGGTITEEYLDLTDPNRTTAFNNLDVISGNGNPRARSVTALNAFMENAEQNNASVLLVLPTYRYFDQSSRGLTPQAEQEIKVFVRNVLNDNYGTASIIGFEIGNEWYQSRFSWTTEEFGNVQHQISVWIDDVYRDLGIVEEPDVYVQAGRSLAENETLAAYFDNNYNIIDGVISHLYATNSSGDPLGIGSGIAIRLDEIINTWSFNGAASLDLIISEWNVGESGPHTTIINGIMRFAPLLRVFVEMIENGVDIANIWTAQSPGPAGLSLAEGTGSDLTPTGVLFSLWSDYLRGATLVEMDSGSDLLDYQGTQVGYQYLFESGDDSILYLASGVEDSMSITLNVTDLVSNSTYIFATILSGAPNDTGTGYDSSAAQYYATNLAPVEDSDGQIFITLPVGEYELVQVHFSDNHGVNIEGDQTFNIVDELVGSNFDDLLDGGLGDDTINGEAGHDTLIGAEGDDVIFGGADHDKIFGGDGDDYMEGEVGRDSLDGGNGDDTLLGGNWHDTLSGGSGSDSLEAGNGNDSLFGEDGDDLLNPGLGRDTVDGGLGTDVMAFSDAGVFLEASGDGEGTYSTGVGGQFFGIEILEMSSEADSISGAEYLEVANLRGGDDVLNYRATGTDLSRTELIFSTDGGSGHDILSFSQSTTAVNIWLTNGFVETGNGWIDFKNFEAFIGTQYGDVISGAFVRDGEVISGRFDTGAGDDMISLFGGDSHIVNVGSGDDFVLMQGASGDIYCGSGNDQAQLRGSGAFIDGGDGDDLLNGLFAQQTTFRGGAGNDTLVGGAESDTFIFSNGDGHDIILEFDTAFGADLIDLSNILAIDNFSDLIQNHARQTAAGVQIALGPDTSILLDGVSTQDLSAELFLF